jgi:hypothetical protein
MEAVVVVKNNIEVNPFITKLYENWKDWNYMKDTDRIKYGSCLEQCKIIPLICVKESPSCKINDSDKQVNTNFLEKYNEVGDFFKEINIKRPSRSALLKFNNGAVIKNHLDTGNYYKTKDRYYLIIQSTFHILVGGVLLRLDPGVLYWINNKIPHGILNVGDQTGIILMFDAYQNKDNPHHFIK